MGQDKLNLSSQDVRAQIIELRDELVANLTMIREAIRVDRDRLSAYFKRYGDFRYRPVVATEGDGSPSRYGTATEINIEPLASSMRTTVKSLLDSIRLIEAEILPEDNPEGREAGSADLDTVSKRREALRASFRADTGAESLPLPVDLGPVQRTPKEERSSMPKASIEPTPPKSWRDTTPRAIVQDKPKPSQSNAIENVEKSFNETKGSEKINSPIGLSPAMRASIESSGLSRMSAMRDKYARERPGRAKGSDDNIDDD